VYRVIPTSHHHAVASLCKGCRGGLDSVGADAEEVYAGPFSHSLFPASLRQLLQRLITQGDAYSSDLFLFELEERKEKVLLSQS